MDNNSYLNNIDLKQLIGKNIPITMNISPTGATGGNLSINASKSPQKPNPFTYTDGVINSVSSQKGAIGTMNLTAAEDKINYTLGGPYIISYAGGKAKITIEVSVSKGKTPAPSASKAK